MIDSQTRIEDLANFEEIYNKHKSLFFEDDQNTNGELEEKKMENEDQKRRIERMNISKYMPDNGQETDRNQKAETKEFLDEIGIHDEMKKIQICKGSSGDVGQDRGFELLNIENPINKVNIAEKYFLTLVFFI